MYIIGHHKIINLLERSIEKGKIAQAYLFSGPESVGKFTLAKIFSESLIKKEASKLRNMEARDNMSGLLDLIIVEPEREEKRGITKENDIKIEQIREAQKSLLLFPYSGKNKVLIVNDAHRMTISAQNSLLKILEEPNSTSVIILITHEAGKILPTLKSRCQKINFSLVDNEEIIEGLEKNGKITSQEIAGLLLGRPGIAIELSEDGKKLASWREAVINFEKIPTLGINDRLSMAEKMSKNMSDSIKNLELWIWTLHFQGKKEDDMDNFRRIELIENAILIATENNASGRLILENLMLNL